MRYSVSFLVLITVVVAIRPLDLLAQNKPIPVHIPVQDVNSTEVFEVPYWLGAFYATVEIPSTSWYLPATVGNGGSVYPGEFLFIRNYGPENITLYTDSPETIDGSISYLISPGSIVEIISGYPNWVVVTPFITGNVTCGVGLSCSGTQISLAPISTSGTIAYPSSITTNAYGQITSAVPGSVPVTSVSSTDPKLVAQKSGTTASFSVRPTFTVATSGIADYVVSDYANADACFAAVMAAIPAQGALVYVYSGTYNFVKTGITMSRNKIELRGEGWSTILQWAPNSQATSLSALIDTANTGEHRITDFMLIGNNFTNAYGVGIYNRGCSRCYIDHFYITNFAEYGVYAPYNETYSNHASKYAYLWILFSGINGIYMNVADAMLDTIEIGFSGSHNIFCHGCTDLNANKLHVWGSYTGSGMFIDNYAAAPSVNVITNGVFETNSKHGLHFIGQYASTVTACTSWGNGYDGIYIESSYALTLQGNVLANNAMAGHIAYNEGIGFSLTNHTSVVGNTFYNSAGTQRYAIDVGSTSFYLVITGNTWPNASEGVQIFPNTPTSQISSIYGNNPQTGGNIRGTFTADAFAIAPNSDFYLTAGGVTTFGGRYIANAVNYFLAFPGVSGSGVVLSAAGSNADISVGISSKGSGAITLRPGDTPTFSCGTTICTSFVSLRTSGNFLGSGTAPTLTLGTGANCGSTATLTSFLGTNQWMTLSLTTGTGSCSGNSPIATLTFGTQTSISAAHICGVNAGNGPALTAGFTVQGTSTTFVITSPPDGLIPDTAYVWQIGPCGGY